MRHHSLALFLLGFWLALSGHYTAFLIVVGVLSAYFCIVVARRMEIADGEGHSVYLLPAAVTYWPWLSWEIVKSAVSVTKLIWSPRLPISPTMTVVRASQKSAPGIATYANSITLTPGTITTGVKGDLLTVHSIARAGADDVEAGGMDRRVKQFEGAA